MGRYLTHAKFSCLRVDETHRQAKFINDLMKDNHTAIPKGYSLSLFELYQDTLNQGREMQKVIEKSPSSK